VDNWRAHILQEFTPQIGRLTLVADPDGLLIEEGVLQAIRDRGFEVIPFEDHIAFRYVYESTFRTRWDRGEDTALAVVLRTSTSDLNSLPYDLLQAGRQLSFTLGDVFPTLSYPVVAALDRSDLDALYRAQQHQSSGVLGDNASKDFILRQVFEIAPELIKQPADLLHVLLRRHYRGQRIPAMLDERFLQLLRQRSTFDDWPLEHIVPDRQAFLAFLQERWPAFLDWLVAGAPEGASEDTVSYNLTFKGPLHLPFDHNDVRVYIDTLFIDGLLQSVTHAQSASLIGTWVVVGVRTDPQADRRRRLDGLLQAVEETLPAADARHPEWLLFAYRWAELTALWLDLYPDVPETTAERLQHVRQQLDVVFLAWVQSRYAGLHNQPALPPVMLHHVPRALAHHREGNGSGKVALIVVDGLALDQWIVLREVLHTQRPALIYREHAVFAWLPTITSVSRQALFAGKLPLYFPRSIHTTDREPALWTQFWTDQGLTAQEVGYLKGLGDGTIDAVATLVTRLTMRVVGLVVDKVDRIMHGMELGAAGMHNQVHQWTTQGYMAQLLDLLLNHGFQVTITADHGNIEAVGCGRPREGAVADIRGERVRVYPDSSLRAMVQGGFPETIAWPTIGLPGDFLPLMAPGRRAFINPSDRVVAHGGISIEELVVPMIHVERRTL
jgi:hypothetical protein